MIQPDDFINILKVGGAKDGEEATDCGAVDQPTRLRPRRQPRTPARTGQVHLQMAGVLAIDKTLRPVSARPTPKRVRLPATSA
ncbi:MAG: hypothetical protein R2710_23605 [Acidimicrobiales bacterium]